MVFCCFGSASQELWPGASKDATTRTTTTTTATLWRGTFLGPPPTGHVLRFIDSGVFVLPVGGPSRSLLEVRGAPWVALPAKRCVSVGLLHPFWCLAGGTTAFFHVIFPRDSDVTFGSFAVHFGRRFGTKLGGVWLQKSCVSARQGGGFGAR